jgi:hypothetical protein
MRRHDRGFARRVAPAAVVAALGLSLAGSIRVGAAEEPTDPASDRVTVEGKVVDPEGRPVPGAKLFVGPLRDEQAFRTPRTTTDTAGRYRFAIARSEIPPAGRGSGPWGSVQVVAEAAGFGPAWTDPGAVAASRSTVLRLARDDVPIEGTVADLEGRPLAGVKVDPIALYAGIPRSLDAFLEAYRDNPFSQYTIHNNHLLRHLPVRPPSWPAELTTDEQGRFRLTGVGRDRLVALGVRGPTIESLMIYALSRRDVDLKRADRSSPRFRMLYEAGANVPIIYGSRFHHLANPSRPITGTVRERDTGRPVAGIEVMGVVANHETSANARTDAQGRFQLLGLPIEGKLRITVFPAKGQSFLRQNVEHRLRGTEAAPVQVDIKVARGVLVRGRLIDAATRQPVPGSVAYLALSGNPHLAQFPELGGDAPAVETEPDGSFELVGLPGPGALGGRAFEDRFCMSRPESWGQPADTQGFYATANLGLVSPIWFHTVVRIEPEPDATELHRDLVLVPGLSIPGRLVDPDGRAMEGVSATRLTALGFVDHLPGSSFRATGLEAERPRSVWFLSDQRTLGRLLRLPGQEKGPMTVTLQPCGTLIGRLVDPEGRPKANARLVVVIRGESLPFEHETVKTDAEGRFRTTGLIPGLKYAVIGDGGSDLVQDVSVRIGQLKDLGDLKE